MQYYDMCQCSIFNKRLSYPVITCRDYTVHTVIICCEDTVQQISRQAVTTFTMTVREILCMKVINCNDLTVIHNKKGFHYVLTLFSGSLY